MAPSLVSAVLGALVAAALAGSGCGATGPPRAAAGAGASSRLVHVPAGPFMMGCNARVEPTCEPDELPYHAVTVPAFYLDRVEVTQMAYYKCITAGDCERPSANFDPAALAGHPVTNVTWDQAAAYCRHAASRLPTEAEWEKAARGTDGRRYPWGNDLPDCTRATLDICGFVTDRAGSHPSGVSPYGALDLAGNVAEWVADWYAADWYARRPKLDPRGPEEPGGDAERVRRGGDTAMRAVDVRASNRVGRYPAPAYYNLGFRCAR